MNSLRRALYRRDGNLELRRISMADTAMVERALLTPEMINHVQPDSFRVHPWASSLEYRDLGLFESSKQVERSGREIGLKSVS
jgi:hypothetical protein